MKAVIGQPICLQIGDIRTVLLDVPESGQTTRIILPERYKRLPLKAERLDENYKKPNNTDDMWPCVLSGWKQQKSRQQELQIQSNITSPAPFDQSAIVESNQVMQGRSNESPQSSQLSQIQSNQPSQFNIQPDQLLFNQRTRAHFNRKTNVPNDTNPTKIDAEPTKISAKLTIV